MKHSTLVCHQGDVHQALIVLQKGVAQCFPDDQPLTDPRSLQTKGKAMLLVGRFMEETANFESNAIMKAYKVTTTIFVEGMNQIKRRKLKALIKSDQ